MEAQDSFAKAVLFRARQKPKASTATPLSALRPQGARKDSLFDEAMSAERSDGQACGGTREGPPRARRASVGQGGSPTQKRKPSVVANAKLKRQLANGTGPEVEPSSQLGAPSQSRRALEDSPNSTDSNDSGGGLCQRPPPPRTVTAPGLSPHGHSALAPAAASTLTTPTAAAVALQPASSPAPAPTPAEGYPEQTPVASRVAFTTETSGRSCHEGPRETPTTPEKLLA